ncbi:MAG: phage major capsid protein [Desulfobacteria bacterium]
MSEKLFRTMTFQRAAASASGVGATLATETPIQRNGYFEVLGCRPDEVDLKRAACNGLPLLLGHDHGGALIGRVKELRADGQALRGRLIPATNAKATEVWADISAGVASDLSVGYEVKADSAQEIARRDGLPVYRFKWAPFEVSVVNVPADAAAGIGRTIETQPLQERSNTMSALKARFVDGKSVSFKEPAKEFSLASFVRSQIGGNDKADTEMAECKRIAESGSPARYGFYVPLSALRDLGATGASSVGGYLVGDDTRNDLFTDYLRAVSVAGKLGVSTIPKLSANIHVPRFTAGASGYWVAEGEAPTESTPTAGSVYLTPKRVAAFIDYTRALVLQAVGLEEILRRDLSGAIGAAVDSAMLNGAGASNEPLGILGTSGVGSISGASFSITTAAALVGTVETANVPLSGPGVGWVMPPAVAELLRKREAASGSGFIINENRLLGWPVHVSISLPAATILFGNFGDGVQIAQWGPAALDIAVDPYTGAKNQLVSIVANAWLDVFVRWPAAFCKAVSVS